MNKPPMTTPDKQAREALIEQILDARQKRAEAVYDLNFKARELLRKDLTPDSPAWLREAFDALHAVHHTLGGDPFDMHMRAALTTLRTPAGEPAEADEWTPIEAGYRHVNSVLDRADGHLGSAPVWHGWALREAFVAGAKWQRALTAPPVDEGKVREDWRDDPAADERWCAGLDYGQNQLCAVLGVDPKTVNWDAATETLDGDVQSVIGNILRMAFGDNWPDALSPAPAPAAEEREGEGR